MGQRRTPSWRMACARFATAQIASALLVTTGIFLSPSPRAFGGDFVVDNPRDVRLIRARVYAAQFLSKATFGPTQESIEELAVRIAQVGYKQATSEWIDQQFELPITSHEQTARDIIYLDGNEDDQDGIGIARYRYQAWWHIALTSEDQLRQRVAFALSQIFVIGDSGNNFNNNDRRLKASAIQGGNPPEDYTIPDWLGMSDFYDMLASGVDGTYRDLLEDVTYHPCMGTWLSSVRNRKANVGQGRFPDENYAREIMQLFSIGLYRLQEDGRVLLDENGALIPTYDNAQIKELARLFTGFRYAHNTNTNSINTGRNLGDPMQIYVQEHDTNYNYTDEPNPPPSKTVFGVVLPPLASPINAQAVEDEIGAGLDVISEHPNVAPFISRLLIQRLVKSNPSRGYMRRVTRVFNDNGEGVRGDMRAVVKAILTDPELYRGQKVLRRRNPTRISVIPRGTEYTRLREPLVRLASLIRAARPTTDYAAGYMMIRDRGNFGQIRDIFGQAPFRSPSVFNFYLPEFQPPGDLITYKPTRRNPSDALYAPEFQILHAVTANLSLNQFRRYCNEQRVRNSMVEGTCEISFHFEPEIELARDLDNLDLILERLDLWLCNGSLSETTKTSIKNAVIAETTGRDHLNRDRFETMLHLVVISPDCAVEQ
ncbi:MAG: DUF1800 family protein [Planctomycetota bacterium]